MKKITLFLVCAWMFSMYTWAQTSGVTGNLNWTLADGVLTISGTGAMPDYTNGTTPWDSNSHSIKTLIIENDVTTIGEEAFAECPNLSSITIGNNVKSIGKHAFSKCYELTSLTIPKNVSSINDSAFFSCRKLIELYNLSNLAITAESEDNGFAAYYALIVHTSTDEPSIITREGDYMFAYYKNAGYLISYKGSETALSLPETFEYDGQKILSYGIYNSAFFQKPDLSSVTIPESVTSIGNYAFMYCRNLLSIDVVKSITTIGEGAFAGCISLASAIIGDSVKSIPDIAFGGCENLTSLVIGKNVTSIGDNAFLECYSLTSLVIPDNIITIGESAFYSCRGLTTVVIGDGVTNIGDFAFFNCVNLLSLTFGENVKDIGSSAFENCFDLTSVTIPESVTNVHDDAFYACEKLVEVYNLSSLDIQVGSKDHGRVAYHALVVHTSADEQSIITHQGDYIFAYYKNAGFLLAYKGSQTDLTFPEMFEYNGQKIMSYGIYDIAFYEKINLTSITIPESVTSIGKKSFYTCFGLTSVIIPNSVDTIKWAAFYNCKNLTSLTIGNSVKTIGISAFSSCEKLKNIHSLAINPPVCENALFDEIVTRTCMLHVPAGRKNVYDTTYVWRDFNITAPVEYVKVSTSVNNNEYGAVTDIGSVYIYTEITLTATPNYGYKLGSWTSNGEIVSTENPFKYVVTEDIAFVANFVPDTFYVSLNVDNELHGIVYGSGRYVYNSEITIEALAKEGYEFTGWTNNNKIVSKDNLFTFTLTQDTSFTATFWEIEEVGIEDLNTTDFNMYPNPVKDILNIESAYVIQKALLYNINGQVVLEQENIGNTIDMSALPKGVYVLLLTTSEGKTMLKVMK